MADYRIVLPVPKPFNSTPPVASTSGWIASQGNRDLPVVFERGASNVVDFRAACGAQGCRQFMMSQKLAAHDILVQHAIVDQRTRRSLNQRFQLLALEGHESNAVVQRDQRRFLALEGHESNAVVQRDQRR